MSTTYSMFCEDCNESHWVGQSTRSKEHGFYLYHGNEPNGKNYDKALELFLADHQGHHLTFESDFHSDINGKTYKISKREI